MIRLIHGADFHLDSSFSGLSPDRAAQRRQEQRELLLRLAQLVVERKADMVLLSGDLFDSARVYRETAQTLAQALGTMPCPVFIAPGNHDFFTPGCPYDALTWPDNVHIFTSERMEGVTLSRLNCTIWGRAFTGPQMTESPLAGFHIPRQEGQFHVMTLHGDVVPGSQYGPITPEDVASSGLDYLALGHIHSCSGPKRTGSTTWAYPGCPEGRGFDEPGEKGVLYVELEAGRTEVEFVPLCRHRYEQMTVDITDKEPLEAILQAIPEGTEEDIYRIRLAGEGRTPDLRMLEEELTPHFFGLTLLDCTRLPHDVWERRGEDSLTGIFLSLMWDRCQADPENSTLQQAVRFGLAALEHGEDPYL